MQTTLLSLAMAAILALLAALFGPYFVDWTQYREAVEARAGAVLGTKVQVRGAIDLRLLPIPWISAEDVEIGEGARARAHALTVTFAFSPMLRGEWRAAELKFVAPEATLTLDAAGGLAGFPQLPGLDPDSVSIERLSIDNGTLRVAHEASGSHVAFEKVSFSGDLKSLVGPLRGEGGFVLGGQALRYKISLGRTGEESTRGRLAFESMDGIRAVEAEGALRVAAGALQFEGGLTATKTTSDEPGSGPAVRLNGKLRASAAISVLDQIEIQIGPPERPARITGAAELRLGRAPRLNAVLSARQIDVDALLGPGSAQKPLDLVAALAQRVPDALGFPVRAQLGFSVDSLTLGGGQIANLRGDVRVEDDHLAFDDVEMRAPGFSIIRLGGKLSPSAKGPVFVGPGTVEATDARLLFAWLEGRNEGPGNLPLKASATLTVGPGRLALDGLKAEVDRRPLEGRLAYVPEADGKPARLEAFLKGADLNADALYASVQKLLAGRSVSMPGEVQVDLDFAKAAVFGVSANGVASQLRFDRGALTIDRLDVADLGGTALRARGRVDDPLGLPSGGLTIDVDGGDIGGVVRLLAALSPAAAEQVRDSASRLTPLALRLRARLDRSAAQAGLPAARLDLEGRAGLLRIGLIADARDVRALNPTDWHVDARLESDDGGVLAQVLGIDRLATVTRRAGWLRIVMAGKEAGPAPLEARLFAGGVEAASKGSLSFTAAKGVAGDLSLDLKIADAGRLRHPTIRTAPLPMNLTARARMDGPSLSFTNVRGSLAGSAFAGTFEVNADPALQLRGNLEVERADANVLAASALGLPPGPRDGWSGDPFAPRFPDVQADVNFKIGQLDIAPRLEARDAAGKLRIGAGRIALEAASARIGAGFVTGQARFSHGADGSLLDAQFAAREIEAEFGLSGDGPPRVGGLVSLSGEVKGAGLSPASLVGSLEGTATVTFDRAFVAGLDAKIFERAMRAADQGMPLDAGRVGDFVTATLDQGKLPFGRAEAALVVSAGRLRLSPVRLRADGLDVLVTGQGDIESGGADAQITLSGERDAASTLAAAPGFTLSLNGPAGGATRSVDVRSLVAWLALRSAERQSKRIEAIENAEREAPLSTSRTAPAAGEAAPPLPPAIVIPGTPRPSNPPTPTPVQRRLPRPAGSVPAAPPQRTAPLGQQTLQRDSNPTGFEAAPILHR